MFHLVVLFLLYFLPTIIASNRGHHVAGILLLNFFFAWTGIGWIIMLLWALLSAPPYYYHPYYGYWRRY
jgi:threonine/homoserine/homoserine lactone efflux protein